MRRRRHSGQRRWRARHLNVWREGGGAAMAAKTCLFIGRRGVWAVYFLFFSSLFLSVIPLFVAALSPQTVSPLSSSLSNCCCRLFRGGRRASHLLSSALKRRLPLVEMTLPVRCPLPSLERKEATILQLGIIGCLSVSLFVIGASERARRPFPY